MSDGFQLHRDPAGALRFTDASHENVAVTATPAFPLSEPDAWIALRDADGEELALVENSTTLPDETHSLLSEELRRSHFVPRVTRIHRISQARKGLAVRLETDRGPASILLDDDEHIRRISATCVVLMDTNGIRFLIPDTTALDRHSRNCLDRFC
jgi:hypothetical protein